MATKPKRPRDPNQLAKLIVDLSVGEAQDIDPNIGKNPSAVAMAALGASKGGKARAAGMSAEKRKEIAKKAAEMRWAAKGKSDD